MKNLRALLMIAVSLIAGILAIVFAARWLNQQTALATTKVAVAAMDLPLGQQLQSEHVRMLDWPTGAVPAGAFTDPAKLKDRVTRIEIKRDEPILESKLAPEGTKGGLAAVIPPGKRAMTVRVNEVIGVGGFALPGNYVDVIVNTRDESKPKEEQTISKIVLEKILVLAVDTEVSRDETKPKVVKAVTLEVTPEQAEAIDLARNIGQLSLVLRSQVDTESVSTPGITKDVLLGTKALPPPKPVPVSEKHVEKRSSAPAAKAPKQCVELLMGLHRSEKCF